MEIRPLPPPVTRIDKPPKATPRDNPADVTVDRPRDSVEEGPERRRNPDRRQRGRGNGTVVERRISGNRRRRSVDITI